MLVHVVLLVNIKVVMDVLIVVLVHQEDMQDRLVILDVLHVLQVILVKQLIVHVLNVEEGVPLMVEHVLDVTLVNTCMEVNIVDTVLLVVGLLVVVLLV
jgi:hypothetical protein